MYVEGGWGGRGWGGWGLVWGEGRAATGSQHTRHGGGEEGVVFWWRKRGRVATESQHTRHGGGEVWAVFLWWGRGLRGGTATASQYRGHGEEGWMQGRGWRRENRHSQGRGAGGGGVGRMGGVLFWGGRENRLSQVGEGGDEWRREWRRWGNRLSQVGRDGWKDGGFLGGDGWEVCD